MRALGRLFLDAGFPAGVFQPILADNDQVAKLIAHPAVAALTFTGSGATGRHLAGLAGQSLKPSVMELGGSDAFIVTADADLARAIPAAVEARLVCHGQSCIAAKRFLIEAPVYDAFLEGFAARMRDIRLGPPRDPATVLGPLVSREQAARLDAQVAATLAAGGRLLVGGRKPEQDSAFFPATVLVDVPWASPAATEELFGPVAPVFRVADLDEAIARANASAFGLAASVWTSSRTVAAKAAAELAVGTVFVNGQVASDARFPFGGVKESGYGRELGLEGLRELVNVKTVRMTF
jgi:succinate-semialdehyde dehydrogenase/glutarate-semialdehyde dehydrogenase